MRILLMANGTVGLSVAKYLKSRGEEIVGLSLHHESIRREGDEIMKELGYTESDVIPGDKLREPEVVKQIESLKPDIIVCAFWAYILKPDIFTIPEKGTINMHPGYLPYARGKNPNVWPIVEETPGGVTIHYIDEGIDTGDIIGRTEIPIESTDTGGSYYEKTLNEIVRLFEEVWPSVRDGKDVPLVQDELKEKPTFHTAKDVDELDFIDLEKEYKAKDLINTLRARTYGSRSFAYFKDSDGKKVNVGVFFKENE